MVERAQSPGEGIANCASERKSHVLRRRPCQRERDSASTSIAAQSSVLTITRAECDIGRFKRAGIG